MANSGFPMLAGRAPSGWFDAMPQWLDRPENFAGLALRRSLAFLIDAAILGILWVIAWIVFLIPVILSFGLLVPLFGLIPLAYHTLLIGGRRAATFGMRLCDVKMMSWTGERPNYVQALVMTVLFYATVGPSVGLVLLIAVFNPRRRLLHDLLSGIVAVRASAMAQQALPPAERR